MNAYLKLYGWLWEAFGRSEFSLREFNSVFPSPQAKKVIHDLVSDGYLERVERGEYRVREPAAFVSGIVKDSLGKEGVLEKAEKRYAFCGNDAVSIWTEGYYFTGFTKGFNRFTLRFWRRT